jgi:uncharacterized protein with PIN domain
MNIVDSSCWIEYLMDTEKGASVAPVIENAADLIVPTITLYEIFKKLPAEKGYRLRGNLKAGMERSGITW